MSNKTCLTANEIRTEFLNYFKKNNHTIVPSSSLIPGNDPTLLFTNSGMVQFKDVFLGKDPRPYTRATSSQRCVRAGGKHNDLERVGYTARHHTFFEMLGNFSFGDYFKKEAIQFAWTFLTDILHLPPEKLWVTVFHEDKEAEKIWLNEMKINPTRFTRCGEKDNFWSMGPTGPCGPCTEIFYDHGDHIWGGPPGSAEEDGDRYVEIWNLVFMQFNRTADGTLLPLPKPSVDTGMGLERISAVMQGVTNNYDIDIFRHIIQFTANLAQIKELENFSLRVIADHIRSCAFLITDGVLPSNEGRGYVLRRIMRRALRHGNKLGLTDPFFFKLVKPLADKMGEAYPVLIQSQKQIEKIILQEEEQFSQTLSQGIKLFDQVINQLHGKLIPGDIIFKLYDTYGFPVDLTADMARERSLEIDIAGFESAMEEQRKRSRSSSQFEADYQTGANIEHPTEFTGYHNLSEKFSGKILALYRDGNPVDTLKTSEKGSVILDCTPFYAESGGQVGDTGLLHFENNFFRVHDTIKQGQAHVHLGKMEKGNFHLNEKIFAEVDNKRRAATVLNHSATHLLHMVLRQVLGDHVIQKGSLVEPERLRFDFSHSSPLTHEEIKIIEQRVNEEIRNNNEAHVHVTTPEKAIAEGAMALFGEKYGDEVRVVKFGNSVELCGGTHAHRTGDIGFFKIISESGVAAGIRRLEAVTGEGALLWIEKREEEFNQKNSLANERVRTLEKQLEQFKDKLAAHAGESLASEAIDISGTKILVKKLEGMDPKSLRDIVDQLKNKLHTAVIVLAVVKENKVSVVAGVTENCIQKIKAGELVNHVAVKIGGKGGGRNDLAEAGGNQPEQLDNALHSVLKEIKEKF